MAVIQKVPFNQVLVSVIEKAIKEDVEAAWEEKKQRMIEELEREKSKSIAGIVLYVMKTMDIQTIEDRLIITVRQEK